MKTLAFAIILSVSTLASSAFADVTCGYLSVKNGSQYEIAFPSGGGAVIQIENRALGSIMHQLVYKGVCFSGVWNSDGTFLAFNVLK